MYYGHSNGNKKEYWEPLSDHLEKTANMTKLFAEKFNLGKLGYIIGLIHDIGKYSEDFQNKLLKEAGLPYNKIIGNSHHSLITGEYLFNKDNKNNIYKILYYIISAHHTYLHDHYNLFGKKSGYIEEISKKIDDKIILEFNNINLKELEEEIIKKVGKKSEFCLSVLIRMLYSCLIDSDCLCSENFMDINKFNKRSKYNNIDELLNVFSNDFLPEFKKSKSCTFINNERNKILQKCIEESKELSNIYTLRVPTGLGKTISSMAFALNHAKIYNKDRIIYVIPYCSIIEQTADIFRKIFGNNVIEHHSNINYDNINENDNNLACENWDAPIIITTSVQFFESLFSSNRSSCRKLHNIANSVVIMDEIQLLPIKYINPIFEMIKELYNNYKTTFILTTATMPLLKSKTTNTFNFNGIETKEIINNPNELYNKFIRTEINTINNLEPITFDDVANKINNYNTVLAVVNTRKNCENLYNILKSKNNNFLYHLSNNMCGKHKSEVIKEIMKRLYEKLETKVVSTQIIEAGVDISFPIVFREITGIDSIEQIRGRCNREGEYKIGQVYIFRFDKLPNFGDLKLSTEIGLTILKREKPIITLKEVNEYFEKMYWAQELNLDKKEIIPKLKNDAYMRFEFNKASKEFKIIEDYQIPIVIQYDKNCEEIIKLIKKNNNITFKNQRNLQRYIINISKKDYDYFKENKYTKPLIEDNELHYLDKKELYNNKTGIILQKDLTNGKI